MTTVRSSDDTRIAYHLFGSGDRNVVFLHGWAGSSDFWDSMRKHFQPDAFRGIAIDYRSHGRSEDAMNGFSHEQFTDDVLTVADAAGAEEFTLVGFSMSARFAQYVACVAPERVRGQILLAGCPTSELPLPEELVRDWVSRAGHRTRMRDLLQTFITAPVPKEVLDRYGEGAARVPALALEETLRMCTATSFADRISRIDTPTLVIAGRDDSIFSPGLLQEAVVRPIKGATLEILECGHEIPIEKPRDAATMIERFVAGVPSNHSVRAK